MVLKPSGLLELIFQPWPILWAYVLLGLLCLICFTRWGFPSAIPRVIWLPLLAWFAWQFIAATQSVNPGLSGKVVFYFATILLLFLLGLSAGRSGPGLPPHFWWPILGCLAWVLWLGFEQHHGGLEATRKEFYSLPDWQSYPADYLKKLQSNRIFSSLVYPNAFAGLLLLILPASFLALIQLTARLPRPVRITIIGLVAYLAAACFYWTGSKGGWLIALGLAAIWALHLPFARRLKIALVAVLLLAGLSVFSVRFADYFRRGATSASARFIYWQGALKIAQANPVFGTGPGTFAIPFKAIKPAEAEMAKLVHNDYLEQLSDSGLVGFIAYSTAISALLVLLYRKSSKNTQSITFLIWIGLLGWAAQSLIEFGLYIPALAWPAFFFFGYLLSYDEPAHSG